LCAWLAKEETEEKEEWKFAINAEETIRNIKSARAADAAQIAVNVLLSLEIRRERLDRPGLRIEFNFSIYLHLVSSRTTKSPVANAVILQC
jgi:hypothetical protein